MMTDSSISVLSILIFLSLFCGGCGRDPDVSSEAVEDVVSQPSASVPLELVASASDSSIEVLRLAAENNQADAQRELAKRLLFGDGVPANPAESIRWARRAAMNGDELASLWTGRAALNEPIDRIEAGAWFMIAQEAQQAFVREDAAGELEALNLQQDELSLALARAATLRELILTGLE